MLEEIYEDIRQHMGKSLEALRHALAGIRTGRASTSLLDGIRIDYYGTATPLNQLASLSVPEPRLLTIKPYEQSLIPQIEKAIMAESTLGLNPSNDGTLIRLPIPELTEERRIELTKVARNRGEDGKVAVRHARREGLDLVDEAKKEGEISEDDARHAHDHIQKMTDECVKQVDEIVEHKEQEIMEV
ncbi:ribosome recycling factor [Candidatus Latescibacterota bacterium]